VGSEITDVLRAAEAGDGPLIDLTRATPRVR
jgi:hypothetical protein